MGSKGLRRTRLAASIGAMVAGAWMTLAPATIWASTVQTVSGMPSVVDPSNLYSEAGVNRLSPAVKGALSRVYVPNLRSDDVYVIDPSTYKVIDKFPG